MLKEIKNNKEYSKYIPEGDFVYDEILKTCRLLITDYSSIAYDAYYRGSNVIFYWEEKEECMKEYGENAKLMLNEKNVFADVCYNSKELSKVIEKNYNEKQSKENIKKFKKIVEFDDNKNAERLIEMLIKDNVISKK
jgi:CDP-glycerol glycerophosphotransferase (TagB/SpsB family)